MMKLTFSISLLFTLTLACNATNDSIYRANITQSIREFVSQNQNNDAVFILSYFSLDSLSEDFCLGITYVLNEGDFTYSSPRYYFTIGARYCFVYSENIINQELFNNFNLIELDRNDYLNLRNEIFHSRKGAWTYEPNGFLICFKNGIKGMKTYENTAFMPKRRNQYNSFTAPIYIDIKRIEQ